MNPSLQDDAALFALALMSPEEGRMFEAKMRADPELAQLVDELRDAAAELATVVPERTPHPQVKSRLMAQVAAQRRGSAPIKAGTSNLKKRFAVWAALGWGIAAVFAATAAFFAFESTRLQRQLAQMREGKAELTRELASLREQNVVSRMQIATLQSSLEDYNQGVAVVVWDSGKREGILKLEKMPPVDAQKDYQLWVVDTKNPVPVNAGVVKVDTKGFARIDFKPAEPVTEAAKFALSVERKGGVPRNEGPIILIGP